MVTNTNHTRSLLIGGGLLLLAAMMACLTLLVIVMNQNTDAAEQAEHDRHVAICDTIADRTDLGEGLDAWNECMNEVQP